MLLGAAGILEGKRATSHWAVRDYLRNFGAEPVCPQLSQGPGPDGLQLLVVRRPSWASISGLVEPTRRGASGLSCRYPLGVS